MKLRKSAKRARGNSTAHRTATITNGMCGFGSGIGGLILVISSTVAHADYTVINDDLLPESVIQSRMQQQRLDRVQQPLPRMERIVAESYSLPFMRGMSALTLMANDTLNELLPFAKEIEVIRIVGRPDMQNGAAGAALASKRAINIRDYLIKRGLNPNQVEISTDEEANSPVGNTFSSDVYVTRKAARQQQQQWAQQAPQLRSDTAAADRARSEVFIPTRPAAPPIYQQPSPAPVFGPTVSISPVVQQTASAHIDPTATLAATPTQTAKTVVAHNTKLIQYINAAVESGSMSPMVALTLLRTLEQSESAGKSSGQPFTAMASTPQQNASPKPLATASASAPPPAKAVQRTSSDNVAVGAPTQDVKSQRERNAMQAAFATAQPLTAGITQARQPEFVEYKLLPSDITLRGSMARLTRQEAYELVWDLPPALDPPITHNTPLLAPSFPDAMVLLLKDLYAKGYTAISIDVYADRVIRFSEKQPK